MFEWMPTRREQLLDAAVTVLALRGARDLTHRAVDRQARLPLGSASNVFRTRASLIDGILEHLIDQELQNLPSLMAPPSSTVDEGLLIALSGRAVSQALKAGRRFTLARKALFLEAARDPAASERLAVSSQFWWETVAGLLSAAGASEPEQRSRLLLAYIDGVIADQLARPESDFDPNAAMAPAVHGILTSPTARQAR